MTANIAAALALLITSLGLWIMAAVCMKGSNRIFLSGYIFLPKEDKDKFREEYDVIAMNKFIGKVILLPASAIISFSVIFLFLDEGYTFLTAAFTVAALAVAGFCIYGAIQVMGGRFKKDKNEPKRD
ncbi:MAG: DUF3784 domain-containing protein [Defluviitaleaceae bacterium]|nr:DUF3784 domain-containing protein [Defluviitaleaceae bacterium]MCL2836198.1 DUF3784 domain-containing protein [Defluviitaleaceae bacterium]